jgi:hypothetical protein
MPCRRAASAVVMIYGRGASWRKCFRAMRVRFPLHTRCATRWLSSRPASVSPRSRRPHAWLRTYGDIDEGGRETRKRDRDKGHAHHPPGFSILGDAMKRRICALRLRAVANSPTPTIGTRTGNAMA